MDYPLYRSAYTAAQIEAAIGKGPIIVDGYWAVWDITAGEYVNTGVQAEGESMISAMRDASEDDVIVISAVDGNGTPTSLASARIEKPMLSTLTVSGVWTGENPYYAAANVSASISPNSKIDVQLSADQIITLQAAGVTALLVENDYPSVRVCAIGGYPIGSLSLQCTVTEVYG